MTSNGCDMKKLNVLGLKANATTLTSSLERGGGAKVLMIIAWLIHAYRRNGARSTIFIETA